MLLDRVTTIQLKVKSFITPIRTTMSMKKIQMMTWTFKIIFIFENSCTKTPNNKEEKKL